MTLNVVCDITDDHNQHVRVILIRSVMGEEGNLCVCMCVFVCMLACMVYILVCVSGSHKSGFILLWFSLCLCLSLFQSHACALTHTYMYACVYTQTDTLTRTHAHMHTHTNTHICPLSLSPPPHTSIFAFKIPKFSSHTVTNTVILIVNTYTIMSQELSVHYRQY